MVGPNLPQKSAGSPGTRRAPAGKPAGRESAASVRERRPAAVAAAEGGRMRFASPACLMPEIED
ncbi:MAG TPA: hypothetical protein VFE31_01850 [Opitutaceae bacterium]|jgi:hypothetical protein|nr:hypothetical protein [Opitutaceae bacterium]